jgi:hypothetical protein
LILVLVALAYYAVSESTGFLMKQNPAAMHGVAVGGGVFLAALDLLIAWGQLKQRARTTLSPHGQKKPVLVVLLPLATLWLYGAGMIAFGLSYWWGGAWGIAAGLVIVAAMLMTGVSFLYERHLVQAQKP